MDRKIEPWNTVGLISGVILFQEWSCFKAFSIVLNLVPQTCAWHTATVCYQEPEIWDVYFLNLQPCFSPGPRWDKTCPRLSEESLLLLPHLL